MLKSVADAIFVSLIRYGLPLYCPLRLKENDSHPVIIKDLKVTFNDCLRLLTNKTWEDHATIEEMLKELKWKSINQITSGSEDKMFLKICAHLFLQKSGMIDNVCRVKSRQMGTMRVLRRGLPKSSTRWIKTM